MTRKYGVFGKKGVRAAASGFETHRASGFKLPTSGRSATRMKVHGHGFAATAAAAAPTAPTPAPKVDLPAPPWRVESCIPVKCPTTVSRDFAKRRFSGTGKRKRRRRHSR